MKKNDKHLAVAFDDNLFIVRLPALWTFPRFFCKQTVRLKQLKISGFKSFADTTIIEFPHSVTGIVGPNGCGKSNVIDAIRWVLGEGRISELRGQSSMTELIFSGSQTRPPCARAAVEMVLDNADGQAAGNWGRYSELAVKRVVTRDGSSSYMVNGQNVRRRDVQDIFMGTGLGPRSYAIISQGMISNFIRAKPEELRVYLEEAAGVSKYKERRRETENSLAATRSNLEKIALVQESKKAEIERLEAEAAIAQQWDELESERFRSEMLWYFLQEKEALDSVNALGAQISEQETALIQTKGEVDKESAMFEEKRAQLEQLRERTEAARKKAWDASQSLAQAKTDAEKLLQRRDFCRDRMSAESEQANLLANQAQEAQRTAEQLRRQAQSLQQQSENALEESEGVEEAVVQADDACNTAAEAYDEARSKESDMQNRIGIVNAEMEALSREIVNYDDQIAQCSALLAAIHLPSPQQLETLSQQYEEKQAAAQEAAASAQDLSQECEQKRREYAAASERWKAASETEARIEERISALQTVQEKAQAEGKLAQWLQQNGLDALPRLYEKIDIDPQWASAVEAALSVRAAALPLGKLQTAAGFQALPPPARLTFYDSGFDASAETEYKKEFSPLLEHVRSSDDNIQNILSAMLAGCWCVDTLDEALQWRRRLQPTQRLFTRQGHCVEQASVTFWAEDNPQAGFLTRAAEIQRLTMEQAALLKDSEQAQEITKDLERKVDELSIRSKAQAALAQELAREAHSLELELSKAQAALESGRSRRGELNQQLTKVQEQKEEALARRDEADERFQGLDEELALASQACLQAQNRLRQAQSALKELEEHCQSLKSNAQLQQMQAQSLLTRATDHEQSAARSLIQAHAARTNIETLQKELASIEEQTRHQGLEQAAAVYDKLRAEQSECETAQGNAEEELEQSRETLQNLTARQAPLLQKISDLKVKRENWLVQTQTFSSRLEQADISKKDLQAQAAAENCTIHGLKTRIGKLSAQQLALGAVNHAALAHLATVRKALEETARQVADLQQAIGNLEDTIRRIDTETRAMLRETFDAVNTSFSRMFSGLFQGGQAELIMTGDEVLEAGIEVKAQPPGKRNASTRVLSGGEQAMAAIALVFAIFQLNPAPFCLLDEVDAPLDEANQERLARQILDMSSNTQFVMITHHRITMEFLKDLIGVTMREPGVSRVVSVSVDDAVRMSAQEIA